MDRRELLRKSAFAMGVTLSAPAITSILNSCSPSKAPLSWQPKVFNEEQARTIGAIADSILPKTDTPGALELMVDRFVDIMVDVGYASEEKATFIDELNVFIATSKKKYGNAFEDCSDEEKSEQLSAAEKSSGQYVGTVWGTNLAEQESLGFYRKLKGLILLGYYTSEEIGKNVLSYDPVPGKQLGCIPLSEVGNSWTEG